MTFWARWGSSQNVMSSVSWFSSASRARALSTSKMPPQQPDRLPDVLDDRLRFRAHAVFLIVCGGTKPYMPHASCRM
jgi:hypothetical protein